MPGLDFMSQWNNSIHPLLFLLFLLVPEQSRNAFLIRQWEKRSRGESERKRMPNWSRGFLLICARAACTYSSVYLPFISMLLSASRGSEFTRECPAFLLLTLRPILFSYSATILTSAFSYIKLFICHVWEKDLVGDRCVSECYICVREKRGLSVRLIVLWGRGYLWSKEDSDWMSMKEEGVLGGDLVIPELCCGGRKVSRSPQIRQFSWKSEG